jgi:23S rRNA pseudouridine1911/1915/1917 synthase
MEPAAERFELVVGAGCSGERLDRFLAAELAGESRTRLQGLVRAGLVTVGGVRARPRDPVREGDVVVVLVPPLPDGAVEPEEAPLRVLYEDADLVVVDKEAGTVVHPGSGNRAGTLAGALLHRFGALSQVGGVDRPGIVHRLDKETSGCLVVARHDGAHRALVEQFAARRVGKHYLAAVEGCPETPAGVVEARIGRDPHHRQRMAVVGPTAGKSATTRFQVLGVYGESALVLCDLLTGRTHQIRVHLRHLGHPVLGDAVYGRAPREGGPVSRLMLHAWRLSFSHPTSGERLQFEAPVPAEFRPWLEAAGMAEGVP